jgi:S-disulfanyl-L-cysteine oxidoreductase SoxD
MTRAPLLLLVCVSALAACRDRAPLESARGAAGTVAHTPPTPDRFGTIGRRATSAEISAWDIDVNPTGRGLPAGHGTYAAGAALFAKQCAACHGAHGEGLGPYPRLISGPRAAFDFASDPAIPKTVGNYWPYATTLYDYIHRAMPLTAPGSLTSDEIFSVIAYLLAENGVVDKATVIDARSLPMIRMPGRGHFVSDDRRGGLDFR